MGVFAAVCDGRHISGITHSPAVSAKVNHSLMVFLINNDTASVMGLKYEVHSGVKSKPRIVCWAVVHRQVKEEGYAYAKTHTVAG